jgi:nitrate reductase gamma subunit
MEAQSNMPTWLILAKGPAFFFVLTVFVLGLLRLIVLTIWDIAAAIHRAGDKRLPYGQIVRLTLSWLIPITRLHRSRAVYSFASYGFHAGLLIATLFLRNHLDILQSNIGFAWWSISKPILDIFTLIGIAGLIILLLSRIYVIGSRHLSKTSDYLLLILILNIFVSGFVAGRAWNPIPYDGLMLFHTLNGMALLLVSPFSKIAHCVLYPLVRFGGEVAWHFTPQGGRKVVETLHGPEGRKV